MSDDNSNAEAGIASTQAHGAKGRLAQGGSKALAAQHQSGLTYMNERVLTMLVCLLAIILITVWTIETTPVIKYGSTTAIALIVAWFALSITRRRKHLGQLREHQLSEHEGTRKSL